MSTAAERLDDFAMGRGTPYSIDMVGMERAMMDFMIVYGDLPAPAPVRRDARVRTRDGREATVMLVREATGNVTVRYDDRTCETMSRGDVTVIE